MKQITMIRETNARLEVIKSRTNLFFILKAIAKKEDSNLTEKQIQAITTAIYNGKQTSFCGRLFEVTEV